MLSIETSTRTINGITFQIEALMLYVHGCRFCLAVNEYIVVETSTCKL